MDLYDIIIARKLSGGGGGGDTGEVWLVGENPEEGIFELSNVDATDHITELFNNADNYTVFLNGEELYSLPGSSAVVAWADNENPQSATKMVRIINVGGTIGAVVQYMDASTAPTSVEISVKAK